jgi:hypothetical protein
MPSSQTLYLPLAPGVQAKMEIQIIVDPSCPTPNEMPARRAPTVLELHQTAERLLDRKYRFDPED